MYVIKGKCQLPLVRLHVSQLKANLLIDTHKHQ